MKVENLRKYAYLSVCGAAAALLLYLFLRYVLVLLLPFALAFALVYLFRTVAERLARKTRVSARLWRTALSLLSLLVLLGGVGLLLYALVGEAWRFVSGLSESGRLEAMLSAVLRFPHGMLGSGEFAEIWEQRLSAAISAAASSLLSGILSSVTAVAAAVPRILLFLLVAVVSVLYIAWDLPRITGAVRSLLPPAVSERAAALKNGILKTALCYLRSYGILMLMTFVLVLVGLLILRAEYAVLMAVLIALLDVLPVIGVGTLLVPWSVISFLMGGTARGVGLLVLLAAHEVMRQIAEPRILGKSLGVHPLVTLVLLYAGYTLFGLLGLLLVPAVGVLIGALLRKKDAAEIA